MNEELQSTNEELSAVNEEMRDRTEELHELNSFLESVLGSIKAGVVVVDRGGNISVWNNVSEELWGLRADEVRGSALLQLDIGLDVSALKPLIKSCLQGKSEFDELQLNATNRRGQSIACRVTCSPMKTSQGEIEGAILFMDVVS